MPGSIQTAGNSKVGAISPFDHVGRGRRDPHWPKSAAWAGGFARPPEISGWISALAMKFPSAKSRTQSKAS